MGCCEYLVEPPTAGHFFHSEKAERRRVEDMTHQAGVTKT